MANSTTNIDTISSSQYGKEITANAFFDAASAATLYGRRASTCSGLTWGFYGGNAVTTAGLAQIANSTVTLTASTTNYITALKSSGVVYCETSTTKWNDTAAYWRLYSVVAGTATATSYTDSREIGSMTTSAATAITIKDEGSSLTATPTSIDFVGSGVTASAVGDAVTITIPGGAGTSREMLTGARTYYVRTDGSNSNNGLTNSSGGAFLTINKAIDVASALDNGGFDITIQVVAGTYTTPVVLKSFVGSGKIAIRGATADLTSTIISTTSADAVSNGNGHVGVYTLEYLKIQTTTSGYGIFLLAGQLNFQNIAFGACASSHITIGFGCLLKATGNYTINGATANHLGAYDGGQVRVQSITLTISGTPAFSGSFAECGRSGTALLNSVTFSGSATGKRYNADLNGVIFTNGAGSTYLPGSVSGTTATGGQYA